MKFLSNRRAARRPEGQALDITEISAMDPRFSSAPGTPEPGTAISVRIQPIQTRPVVDLPAVRLSRSSVPFQPERSRLAIHTQKLAGAIIVPESDSTQVAGSIRCRFSDIFDLLAIGICAREVSFGPDSTSVKITKLIARSISHRGRINGGRMNSISVVSEYVVCTGICTCHGVLNFVENIS